MRKKEEVTTQEMGYAAGILVGMNERILQGNVKFSKEELDKFQEAVEILKPFDPDELLEIMTFAEEMNRGGVKNGH